VVRVMVGRPAERPVALSQGTRGLGA
jgi:hypothetical protein